MRVFVLVQLLLVSSLHAEGTERFYRMEMGGQPAGWLVERTIEVDTDEASGTAPGRLLVTETHTRMELSRAGTSASMEMFSRFEETVDHRPVSGLIRQALGTAPLETSFRFEGDEVLVSEPGGATRRREMGPKTWMTPAETTDHVTRQIRRAYAQAEEDGYGEFAFEVRRVELLTGLEPITGRYVLQDADDPIVIDGVTRAAGRWAMSESYAPLLTTIAWIDRDGVMLRTESAMMGTTMVMVLTDQDPRLESESSLTHGAKNSAQLPELLVQTFVRPDRLIDSPRRLRRGVYRLTVLDLDADTLGRVVPTSGVQRVSPADDGESVVVTVDLDGGADGEFNDEAGDVAESYLQPSRYLDFESVPVRDLAETWRRESPEAAASDEASVRAESLRRLVGEHLGDTHLGTVLGAASEAAASGSGDCTEHAVLLAALLRTEGIPSRVAVGLVYAQRFVGERNIFVYHMWTQALLGSEAAGTARSVDRWVDLDATLPHETPFDAAHILFATSPLSEEGVPLLGTGAEAVFGRLSIQVLETGAPTE